MVLENIILQEIIQKLGWMLLHFIWQAAVVALLLGILLALLRKSSASARYIIACAAMGLLVLLPIITMQLVPVSTPQPTANIEPPPAPVIVRTQTTTEEISPAAAIEYEKPAQLKSTVAVPNISWKQRAVVWLDPTLPYLVSGWLLGVFGLSLWYLGGWAQLQRLRKKMVRQVDTSVHNQLRQISGRLRVKRSVQLLESALVQVPTVVGWLRPVILLPASALTGLTSDQLEALLAHELAHIRRYDYLVNMLQTIVETLGFYHPAVWWVSYKIRAERENCCDDLAVSISGDRIRYARALTSMEEIRASRSELAVAATGGSFFSRINRLVGKNSTESSRTSWIPSAITILLIAIIIMPTTIALTTSQEPQQETDVMSNVKPESSEWQNIGEIIPPDFNDTKVLTEHISLGSIGQDCEGKVFISCILDSAQSSVRRHRFVLVQKNSDILEPSGYMAFGPENKLQEKFSFNAPFLAREIEGFRFQIKPLSLTGIDDSLLQLQQGSFAAVEQDNLVPSGLAPPGRYAIELDGINDYLLVPDSPSLRLEKPFTVEIWIKTKLPADASKEYGDWALISKGFYVGTPRAWVTGFGMVFQRYQEDPSKLHVDYVTANNSGTYSQTYGTRSILTDGKSGWIHLYHVFDREKYKSTPGHPLVIGKYLIPTTRPLMGQIGEIRIWNGARTREQIRRYENAALTGNEPDLAAWWPFEQKEGQFAYDMSGNNNHARLGSSSGPDDTDPKWIDLESISNQAELGDKPQEKTDARLKAVVFGHVLQDGRNVVGARVIARIRSDQPSKPDSSPPLIMRTDENGLYRFADLPAGRYSIAVMSQKGNLNIAQKQINLEPGDSTELNFGDEEGLTLTGMVTVDGEAVEIASVMIQLPNDSVKWGWTDRNGNFRITGIPSGRHELFTTCDKDLDPVTFLWGKDGKQEYDTRFDRRQIKIESDLSVDIHIGEQKSRDNPPEKSDVQNPGVPILEKSVAPSDEDKSIVKVDLAVVEVPPGSELDRDTIAEINNRLGDKIAVPDPPTVEDLLRNASEATAPVKDESADNKRLTQNEFKTLFDY